MIDIRSQESVLEGSAEHRDGDRAGSQVLAEGAEQDRAQRLSKTGFCGAAGWVWSKTVKTVKICSLSLLLCNLKRELGLGPAGETRLSSWHLLHTMILGCNGNPMEAVMTWTLITIHGVLHRLSTVMYYQGC